MTTTLQKIKALSPCPEGLDRAVKCGTLREWWKTSTTRSDMTWLVGKAHSKGTPPPPPPAADAAADAAGAAMCDVIRDALDIDEVCAALGLDADEQLGEESK